MRVPSAQGAPAAVQQRESPVIDLCTDAAFYREGEYWTIAYEGVLFRLRDTKGLHCVAYLLRHPHEEVSAMDLLMVGGTSAPRPRAPSATATAEQARMTVTKRVKAAVQKIGAHHTSLGHHLSTCIKTGSVCAYGPDPSRPIAWSLGRKQ
jgi:hypothetical protein